jgi:hypothetical protein
MMMRHRLESSDEKKIQLVEGQEVFLYGGVSSGIVDQALIDLCKQVGPAGVDIILSKYVAPAVCWLHKKPTTAQTIETMMSEAMADIENADDNQRHALKAELEFVFRLVSFVLGLEKNKDTQKYADIFVFWLFSFVPEEEAVKIYRPWNENGEKGFPFARKDFTPFEWNGYAPQDLSLDAGGASAAAEMPNQGKLIIPL